MFGMSLEVFHSTPLPPYLTSHALLWVVYHIVGVWSWDVARGVQWDLNQEIGILLDSLLYLRYNLYTKLGIMHDSPEKWTMRWFGSGTKYRKCFTIYYKSERSDCKSPGTMVEVLGKILYNSELITRRTNFLSLSHQTSRSRSVRKPWWLQSWSFLSFETGINTAVVVKECFVI